jgi:hypothetical protein
MIYAHRLVTDTGFIEEFWKRLAEMRAEDPTVTQEDVYEYLNDIYREAFGEDRFKSFDAFRKRRDRKIGK